MNKRDKKLLDLAASNATAQEMEAETGIPAAQAIRRVKELLEARDVWTEIERRQLLLHDLYKIKDELYAHMNADDPRTSAALLRTIQMLSDTMDKQREISEHELQKVSQIQSRKMLEIIGEGFKFMEEEFPDIDYGELRSAFARGLERAITSG